MIPQLVVGSAVILAAYAPPNAVFTLYRNSTLDPSMREHVATFDADESGPYNQKNCWTAQRLFQAQSGVTVTFWCEKGRFHE